ncbi:glycosyltransferase family 2 protein [Alkalibacterium putridalgicola]|uniref:glycosyltransferase family 2 protein n=1 Tax=Alkalibacterium putridalgicola TaxID=426703 RepID=UPI0034CD8184
MNKMISVIIPVYNAENYLSECVDSVMNQSYKNLEIILINDGSTDDSPSICDSYLHKDNRVKVIHQSNGGVSSARNAGLQEASGEYVQFVDSDDFLSEDMCEELIRAVSHTDIAICGYQGFDDNRNVDIHQPDTSQIKMQDDWGVQFNALIKKNLFNQPWNKLYKKSKITNRFNTDFARGEDLLFNLDYFRNISSISVIDKALYWHKNDTPDSLMTVYTDDQFHNQKTLFLKMEEYKAYYDLNKIEFHYTIFFHEIQWIVKEIIYDDKSSFKSKYLKLQNIVHDECTVKMISQFNSYSVNSLILKKLIKNKMTPFVYLYNLLLLIKNHQLGFMFRRGDNHG